MTRRAGDGTHIESRHRFDSFRRRLYNANKEVSLHKTGYGFLFLLVPLLLAAPVSSADPGGDESVKLRVTAEQANIRAEPDIGSRILMQAPATAVFTVIEKQGEWYHIRYIKPTGDSLTGWVHESLVAVVVPAPDPESPPARKQPPEKILPEVIRPPERNKPRDPPPALPAPVRIRPPAEASAPPETPASAVRGDFSLAAGGFSAVVGDLNRGARGLADYYDDLLQTTRQGEGLPLHFGWHFDGEMRYFLTDRLAVGAGVAFLSGSRQSDVSFSSGEALFVRPEIRAVPFRFFGTYALARGFYVKAGLEYTFAECAYHYRFEQGEIWREWQGQAQAHGPGLLAGAGYSRPLSERLELFVEVLGRLSSLSDFEGEDRFRDWEGRDVEEAGTLYIYSVPVAADRSHQLIFIRDRVPAEAGVTDPAKAGLDLSGFSLRMGMRIRF